MGTKPEEAFFVRCDRTTMTQNDLDNGRLICLIGVAPTYPAEFVDLPHRPVDRRRAAELNGPSDQEDLMALRDNPYGAFNFMVKLGDTGGEDQIVGGFSDVSGLGNEVKYSEYRNGNDKENHVRKVANINSDRRRHPQARA